jgi:MarR family transcriptional regulator, organic hydroperoxide resistance regulator
MAVRTDTKIAIKRRGEIGEIIGSIRLIKEVHQRYSWELTKKYRMTGQQAGALMVIARYPDISLGELGDRMYLHISTCSGIVDRLERKGYVTRTRSSEDRRVVRLSVTQRGRRMIAKIPVSGFGMLLKGIESMPANEIHRLSEAMSILLKVMKIEGTERKESSHGG